jgi:hypothetical protein
MAAEEAGDLDLNKVLIAQVLSLIQATADQVAQAQKDPEPETALEHEIRFLRMIGSRCLQGAEMLEAALTKEKGGKAARLAQNSLRSTGCRP